MGSFLRLFSLLPSAGQSLGCFLRLRAQFFPQPHVKVRKLRLQDSLWSVQVAKPRSSGTVTSQPWSHPVLSSFPLQGLAGLEGSLSTCEMQLTENARLDEAGNRRADLAGNRVLECRAFQPSWCHFSLLLFPSQ